ncbi:hypothetical protein GCM10022421_13580 [Oceanisphaera sediminis]|uniref:Type I restriction modification DNA specificity domain-containing protein n=1 Tax=Oceanisphaera sediminis TaxID=981381 RepID=A0ABP7DP80_9GAMM
MSETNTAVSDKLEAVSGVAGKYQPYPEYKDSGVEWLGEIPAHWEELPLKYLSSCNDDVLLETTDPDFEFEYIDIGSVSAVKGIAKTESVKFGKAPSRARRVVRNGDIIVSMARTYLEAIAPITEAHDGMVASTGFAVIRPSRLDSSFAVVLYRWS